MRTPKSTPPQERVNAPHVGATKYEEEDAYSLPPPSRSEFDAAIISGAVAGAAAGAIAGPPGILAGGLIGAVVGAAAGSVMLREDHRITQHDAELDDDLGVTKGTLGTGLPHPLEVPTLSEDSYELDEASDDDRIREPKYDDTTRARVNAENNEGPLPSGTKPLPTIPARTPAIPASPPSHP